MQDFDTKRTERADRDRKFKIGGEVFTMASGVRPEVFASYEDLDESVTAIETLAVMDSVIVEMLEDADGAERYRALRDRKADPITIEDMTELVQWMLAEATGRPTPRPELSTPGPETTGTSLTDVSSQPDTPQEQLVSA